MTQGASPWRVSAPTDTKLYSFEFSRSRGVCVTVGKTKMCTGSVWERNADFLGGDNRL